MPREASSGSGTSTAAHSPASAGESESPRSRRRNLRHWQHWQSQPHVASTSLMSDMGTTGTTRRLNNLDDFASSYSTTAPVSINSSPPHDNDVQELASSFDSLHTSPPSNRSRTNSAIVARHPRLASQATPVPEAPIARYQYTRPPPKPGPIFMSLEGQELRDYAAAKLNNYDQLAAWARDADRSVPAARAHFERIMLGAKPSTMNGNQWTDEVGVEWEQRSEIRKRHAKNQRRSARKPGGKQSQTHRDSPGRQRVSANADGDAGEAAGAESRDLDRST